jgi:hypothetical protein
LPEREEEIQKASFAAALGGSMVLFYDNIKRHISSSAIESAMTATHIPGRILGHSRNVEVENMMTVFLSGNGATVSSDLRRRLLHVDLFLEEARAEDREIEHYLSDELIVAQRPKMLSALWALIQKWDKGTQPRPSLLMPGFETWAEVICGILEHNGFVSPCIEGPQLDSGDTDTTDMEQLVSLLFERKFQVGFGELLGICYEHGLFARLIGIDPDTEIEPGKKTALGKIIKKFSERLFRCGAVFHVERPAGGHSYYWATEPKKTTTR